MPDTDLDAAEAIERERSVDGPCVGCTLLVAEEIQCSSNNRARVRLDQ